MYLVPQGPNQSRAIHELEKRVQALEKIINSLQSEQRPKIGRPPKAKDEPVQDMRSL
jgi:hypothetical protein